MDNYPCVKTVCVRFAPSLLNQLEVFSWRNVFSSDYFIGLKYFKGEKSCYTQNRDEYLTLETLV